MAEAQDDAGGDAGVIFDGGVAVEIGEAGEEIVGFEKTEGQAMAQGHVEASADGEREGVFAGVEAAGAGGDARAAEKHLREGDEAGELAHGVTRADEIGVEIAGKAGGKIAEGITANVGDGGEVVAKITIDRGAAAAEP